MGAKQFIDSLEFSAVISTINMNKLTIIDVISDHHPQSSYDRSESHNESYQQPDFSKPCTIFWCVFLRNMGVFYCIDHDETDSSKDTDERLSSGYFMFWIHWQSIYENPPSREELQVNNVKRLEDLYYFTMNHFFLSEIERNKEKNSPVIQ